MRRWTLNGLDGMDRIGDRDGDGDGEIKDGDR